MFPKRVCWSLACAVVWVLLVYLTPVGNMPLLPLALLALAYGFAAAALWDHKPSFLWRRPCGPKQAAMDTAWTCTVVFAGALVAMLLPDPYWRILDVTAVVLMTSRTWYLRGYGHGRTDEGLIHARAAVTGMADMLVSIPDELLEEMPAELRAEHQAAIRMLKETGAELDDGR